MMTWRKFCSYTASFKSPALVMFTALLTGCIELPVLIVYSAYTCGTKPDQCWCVSPDRKLWRNATGGCPEGWTFYSIEPPPVRPPVLACRNPEDNLTYWVDYEICPDDWADITEERKAEFEAKKAELRASADQGDNTAAFDLFRLLESKDLREAWYWLCRAADGGHSGARTDVALWHMEIRWENDGSQESTYKETLRKLGVGPDDRVAYMWLSLVEDSPLASQSRDTLSERMQPDDLRQAKEMVRDWKRDQCPSKEHPITK